MPSMRSELKNDTGGSTLSISSPTQQTNADSASSKAKNLFYINDIGILVVTSMMFALLAL